MIKLPVLQHLRVEDYGLFPGDPEGSGIVWDFPDGLTLIAGINGLGKTTLLMMILRSLTGPFDLTSDGELGRLSVTVPEKPARLQGAALKFFAKRVANGAQNAKVSLSAKFGDNEISITRKLSDLSLLSCKLNGSELELPGRGDREEFVQDKLSKQMGVGNFVDVLLLLHHVVLFHEDRLGALWDQNAQRHVLRILFLDSEDASKVASLERSLQSADSQGRNIHARITATERDLRKARQREAGSDEIIRELEREQEIFEAERGEMENLDREFLQLDADRQQARLEFERAKIGYEEAAGAVERLKYTALLRLFPKMEDASRLVISRIMTEEKCLICNADAHDKRVELEAQIAQGYCPACGAPPDKQENVYPQHEFEQARLDQARVRVDLSLDEKNTRDGELEEITIQYNQTFKRLVDLRRSVESREQNSDRLRTRLPGSVTSRQYESALDALREQHREWESKRAIHFNELKDLLDNKGNAVTSKATVLAEEFSRLTQDLLSEEVRLSRIEAEPQYLQILGNLGDRIRVPAYAAEMASANRPGWIPRTSSFDVSESQRELIDLAFRLALVKVATGGDGSTFVMETPEASLDGVAMNRVGNALAKFAAASGNRLVVTSNLSNSGLITALFGEPAEKDEDICTRKKKVINLLKIAAPNSSLINHGEEYQELLDQAIQGSSQ